MTVEFFRFTTLWDTTSGVAQTPESLERRTDALRIIIDRRLTAPDLVTLASAASDFRRVRLVLRSDHAEAWSSLHLFTSLVGIQAEAVPSDGPHLGSIPPSITDLSIGLTGNTAAAIRHLTGFGSLQKLVISGDLPDMRFVGGLPALADLFVLYVSNLDFSDSTAFSRLSRLRLQHGSIAASPKPGGYSALRDLEIWRTRGLTDLSWVSSSPDLRSLSLGALPQVESLPSMRTLRQLQSVTLDQMNGIMSIRELSNAPNIERVHIKQMNKIPIEDYRCLVGHPTLAELTAGYTGKKSRAEVAELLKLPPVHYELHADTVEF
jgi:hypothetical protein